MPQQSITKGRDFHAAQEEAVRQTRETAKKCVLPPGYKGNLGSQSYNDCPPPASHHEPHRGAKSFGLPGLSSLSGLSGVFSKMKEDDFLLAALLLIILNEGNEEDYLIILILLFLLFT